MSQKSKKEIIILNYSYIEEVIGVEQETLRFLEMLKCEEYRNEVRELITAFLKKQSIEMSAIDVSIPYRGKNGVLSHERIFYSEEKERFFYQLYQNLNNHPVIDIGLEANQLIQPKDRQIKASMYNISLARIIIIFLRHRPSFDFNNPHDNFFSRDYIKEEEELRTELRICEKKYKRLWLANKILEKGGEISEEFICPITGKLMTYPVILAGDGTGFSFDKSSIQGYWASLPKDSRKNPLTDKELSNDTLIYNRILDQLIEKFLEEKLASIKLSIGIQKGERWIPGRNCFFPSDAFDCAPQTNVDEQEKKMEL